MTLALCIRSPAAPFALAFAVLASPGVLAQSFCSSDRQLRPVALLERFISADCEACWSRAGARPAGGELAVDWIVPGTQGDDAPLSAAASRDASARLSDLKLTAASGEQAVRRRVEAPKRDLRVSHGLPFNGYLGASIELKGPVGGRWSAWLLLVETIPAGADGTPVERNLVRNTLELSWDAVAPTGERALQRLFESRPMSIPAGARPERLRLVGWVEDGPGRIRAIAQTRCAPPASRG